MRIWPIIGVACLCAQPAAAETALPEPLTKAIKANPQRFVEDAAEVIHGFGTPGAEPGVDAVGIDTAIALVRAEARAGATQTAGGGP